MNNPETFAALVAANPLDKITALVAVDYLHEHEEQPRHVALRNVGRWRKEARDLKDVNTAAGLLSANNGRAYILLAEIRHYPHRNELLDAAVYVVPGRSPPRIGYEMQGTPDDEFEEACIYVGGHWVLELNRNMTEAWGYHDDDTFVPVSDGNND